jgi:hypothetical protein
MTNITGIAAAAQRKRRQAQGQRSTTVNLPAPIGGWNARDSLAEMAPQDAVTLTNWFPTTSDVMARQGFTKWATGLPGQVNTVMPYNSSTGSNKLFAASGTGIYDITSGGVVGAPVLTGMTSDKWSYTNFATLAGPFLGIVNGQDGYFIYNGSTWQAITSGTGQTISTITNAGTTATLTTAAPHGLTTGNIVSVSGATPAAYNGTFTITVTGANTFTYVMSSNPGGNATVVGVYSLSTNISGVNPNTLSFITLFASRLWFIQKNSLKAWYLPVGQFGGAAQFLDLSPICRRGGSLVSMGILTMDGGYGVQDQLCFVTSEGEVVIYQGTDPSQSSTFALVGVYQLGTPMGFRSFMKYGGDLLYIGKDGLGPISQLLASTRVNTAVNITGKIQGAISQATSLYPNNYGWCMVLFPLENMVILNIPSGIGQQQQYVMNTITGAWCNFTGWNANHWERFNDQIYFGSDGYVGLAWSGYSDNSSNINAVAQQAFNEFGTPLQKRFTMMRPILWTNGAPALSAGINVDYDQNIPNSTLNFLPTSFGVWDSAIWDMAVWGGSLQIAKAWQGVVGIGMTGSPTLKAAVNGTETHWAASDIVFETGWTV